MNDVDSTTATRISWLSLFFRSDIFTFGFGITVSMWSIGYVFHLPGLSLPSPVMFFLFLSCLFFGGFWASRRTPAGWRAGLASGFLSSILNLLVLGSVLSDATSSAIVPSAAIFIPGFILASTLIAAIGGVIGAVWGLAKEPTLKGDAGIAIVSCLATFVLLIAGGLVTSYDAGLAVVDWPNTFGNNMFLYPLSRMTGGIYYEHTHRLIGSLVGLTTIAVFISVIARDSRKWIISLAGFALLLVIVQGIMGGLRVTGNFTMSNNEADMAPSIVLAIIHGVNGQLFFGLMIALSAFLSLRWLSDEKPAYHSSSSIDRWLTIITLIIIVIQLIFGAVLRHVSSLLLLHITWAGIVLTLVLVVGIRAWGLYPQKTLITRLGLGLIAVTSLQLALGFVALMAIHENEETKAYTALEVIAPTAHQAVGAMVLGMIVLLAVWIFRLTTSNQEASS
ncbi:MAG: COX15/CtaA family protein [Candidatus Hinthialibacter antarcticus]|nr:COX15/CtaA family protein [Candidatus Hinthialibacter antarcticus]